MRNFKELQAKMPAGVRIKSEVKANAMLRDMALDELRTARQMTQEHLAETLGIKQAAVSRMERRTDVYVGTLAKYVEALGGELEILAHFPGANVRITQFETAASSNRRQRKP